MGTVVQTNAAAGRMFGYALAEIMSEALAFLIPSAVDHRIQQQSDLAAGSPDLGVEGKGRRKDGSEFAAQAGIKTVETRGGPLTIAFISGLTAARQSPEARNRGEESFRRLAERLPQAIVLVAAADGRLIETRVGRPHRPRH